MNSFFFWHLTLAHFLTDYLLQTDKLFEKKTKYLSGILIHGFLFFLTMFFLLLPFSFSFVVILGIFLISLLHIFQDKLKIFLSYKNKVNIGENFFYYVIDQITHIFVIFLFSKYFPFPKVHKSGFWFDPFFFKILTFLIIVTYAYWILLYSIEYTFFKHNELVQGKMKFWGFIERAFVFLSYKISPILSIFSFLSTIFLFFLSSKGENKFFSVFRSLAGITLTFITSFIFYNFLL